MSDTILVVIKHLDDLEPARALVSALPERTFLLSFLNEDLRTRFGETAQATSTDPFEGVLNAENLGLALCFAGARELGPTSNLLLLSYFDELGVPSVELQRDLLRDPESARAETAARHYLAWSGPEAIGCPRALPAAAANAARDDVVLVTSHLTGPYCEEQRYQFAFAVMRLAREHPQLCLLWRASAAEEQNGEAKQLLAMLGSSGPANLWLEENEPLDGLLARASAVITMAQSALLDYAAAQKPALVYSVSELEPRLRELSFTRFQHPDELLTGWRALRAEPASFVVKSSIPALRPDKLRAELLRIEATRALRPERRELVLRYLAQMQDVRARSDLGRMSGLINALERRVAEIEKQLVAQRDAAKKSAQKNGKRPLDVAQKAWKLARAVRDRALK
jgi:hypothetical protein